MMNRDNAGRHVGLFILAFLFMLPVCPVHANQTHNHWSRDEVMALVVAEAVRQHFSPALALAVAKVESNFNPLANSAQGALGVMQIMPNTAEKELDIRVSQLYEPETNISGGIRFLKQLIKQYGGRTDMALSHYNGGSRVRQPDGSLRVLPATETYVNNVMEHARRFKSHPLILAVNNQSNRQSNHLHKRYISGVKTSKKAILVKKLQALAHYNRQRLLFPDRYQADPKRHQTEPTPARSYRQALVMQWENIN